MHLRSLSLRSLLVVFVLLAALPLLGLAVHEGFEERRGVVESASKEALQLARLISTQQDRSVEGARQLLVAVARLPAVRDADPQACSQLFASLLEGYPNYANVGAVLPDGRVFCSGIPLQQEVNASDREWFRRTTFARDFGIGDFQIGRITGVPVLVFAYPIFGDEDRMLGLVFAALDLAWLSGTLSDADLPEGTVLTLLDFEGVVLARYPEAGSWIGRQPTDLPAVQPIVSGSGDGTFEAAGLGGVQRLVAFSPLASAPQRNVYVSVGIPRSPTLAAANKDLREDIIVLAVVTVLGLGAAWAVGSTLILHGTQAVVGTARQLAAGDLSARVETPRGPRELADLTRAFDDMARQLERRAEQARESEAELGRSEERYRTLFEDSRDAIYITETGGKMVDANRAALELFGYEEADMLVANVADLYVDPESRLEIQRAIGDAGFVRDYELKLRRKDGAVLDCLISSTARKSENGEIVGYQGVIRDVTESKRVQQELERLATTDTLTELLNRRAFLLVLNQAASIASSRGFDSALIYLDIDGLRYVNEAHGHAVGDQLLSTVAELLRNSVREGDVVARLGGDEFGLILHDEGPQGALERATTLVRGVAESYVFVDEERVHVSCTAGVVVFPIEGANAEDLAMFADAALASAKSVGSNTARLYEPDEEGPRPVSAIQRTRMMILEALEQERFRLWWQPIVSTTDRKPTMYEVLVRIEDSDGKIRRPDEFIPQAEELDLIHQVDRKVVALTFERWRRHADGGQELRLTVNVSARSLSAEMAQFINEEAYTWGVPGETIVLEVTESALTRSDAHVEAFAEAVKRGGFALAIDDFGAGATSLRRVRTLAWDVIKLDGTLIQGIVHETAEREFVHAIVDLVHGIGIEVIAEYVQDEDTIRLLADWGVAYAQGFHIGKPEPFPAEPIAIDQRPY